MSPHHHLRVDSRGNPSENSAEGAGPEGVGPCVPSAPCWPVLPGPARPSPRGHCRTTAATAVSPQLGSALSGAAVSGPPAQTGFHSEPASPFSQLPPDGKQSPPSHLWRCSVRHRVIISTSWRNDPRPEGSSNLPKATQPGRGERGFQPGLGPAWGLIPPLCCRVPGHPPTPCSLLLNPVPV